MTSVGVRTFVANQELEVKDRSARGHARFYGKMNKGLTRDFAGQLMMRVEEVLDP